MRRKSNETRQQIIDAAYRLFYKTGFARTGVDVIAEASGITKRTLYQYFKSKDDLIEAVLEHQHLLALERTRKWADQISGDPAQMITALFDKLAQWAAEKDWKGSGFTRAAIEFADMPGHPARRTAHRHKKEVEHHLAQKFAEQGVETATSLAREVMLLIEGCQSLVLIHGHQDYIRTAAQAARVLVATHHCTEDRGQAMQ